jgi:hypothetical protein
MGAAVITTALYCDDGGENLQSALRPYIDASAADVIDKAVQLADVIHLHPLASLD